MPGPGKPFQKGQSGNPSGRAKGFERRVRELVEPDEIINFALDVMRSGDKDRDRIDAAKFLADRGWGKPRQTVEVTEVEQPQYDYSKLPAEELDDLERLLAKAAVKGDGQ